VTNCWVLIKTTIENELSWLQSFAWIWLIYFLRSFIRRYQAIFRTADLLNMISKSNSASLLPSLLTKLMMNWSTLDSLSYLIEIRVKSQKFTRLSSFIRWRAWQLYQHEVSWLMWAEQDARDFIFFLFYASSSISECQLIQFFDQLLLAKPERLNL